MAHGHDSLGNRAAAEFKQATAQHDNDGSPTSQRRATCCRVFAAGISCAASLRHIALQFCTLFLDANANREEALCACALPRYASEAYPNAKNVRIRSGNGIGKYIKQTHTHTYKSYSL